ncbi:hypothetical protein Tco_0199812 [Tanacetum coccineum]
MYINEEKNTMKLDKVARYLLIQGLLNDIYSLIDNNKTAKELWDALERQMYGLKYDEQDRLVVVLYGFEKEIIVGVKSKEVVVLDRLALVVEKKKVSRGKEKVMVESEEEYGDDDDEDINDLKKVKDFIHDKSGEHLKRDCPIYNHKKSQGFVKNEDRASIFEADDYDSVNVMMAMSVEELLDSIMDLGGPYHIIYKKDNLFYFEEYDGGTRRANCIYALDGQAVTRNTLTGMKHLGEYQTGWKIKTANVLQRDDFEVEPIGDHTFEAEICDSKGLLDEANDNILGMKIIRNQSGNTISVLQSRFYNGKFVQTLLEKHFILSLEGFVDFDYDMGRSINVMGRSIIKNGFLLQGCAISWEGKDKKDKKKKNQSKTDKKREKSSQE